MWFCSKTGVDWLSKREEDYIALLLFIRRRENILIYEILCGCQSLLLWSR